ncbi:small multi-drug export protein [Aureibacillus halotolerans]|uniref:Putative small multi-drug export protein n=1 Tax=Aureibacillus halotolerans TaxID=1508390 RepID=A0A4R6TSA0_9BACI|nr:small multi-drug export protein [Aureibacillus halotolerans]TDQ33730.1 putative small multi-drug export protein [Aureibacillus halotolerans]
MKLLFAYLIVFFAPAIPFVDGLVVIPIGVVAGLNIVLVTLLAFLGSASMVLVVIMFGEKMQRWIEQRRTAKTPNKTPSKRHQRAEKIWRKYGLPGFALLGPVLVSASATAFLAMTFGAPRKATTGWVIGSVGLWCIVFAILSYVGADVILDRTGENGFLYKYLNVNEG